MTSTVSQYLTHHTLLVLDFFMRTSSARQPQAFMHGASALLACCTLHGTPLFVKTFITGLPQHTI
jgi:hypothetical protein